MKPFNSFIEQKRKEREELEQFKYSDGRIIHPSELKDRSISPEELADLRMNTYASEALVPKLDTRSLIQKASFFNSQCIQERIPNSTYDQAIIHSLCPEMVKRLELYYEKYGEI